MNKHTSLTSSVSFTDKNSMGGVLMTPLRNDCHPGAGNLQSGLNAFCVIGIHEPLGTREERCDLNIMCIPESSQGYSLVHRVATFSSEASGSDGIVRALTFNNRWVRLYPYAELLGRVDTS